VLIWIVSFVAVSPAAFFTGTIDFHLPGTTIVIFHYCTEVWPQMSWHLAYSVVLMVAQVSWNWNLLNTMINADVFVGIVMYLFIQNSFISQ